jgi:hypothetical protein
LAGPLWSASDGIYTTVFLAGREGVVCFDTFATLPSSTPRQRAVLAP